MGHAEARGTGEGRLVSGGYNGCCSALPRSSSSRTVRPGNVGCSWLTAAFFEHCPQPQGSTLSKVMPCPWGGLWPNSGRQGSTNWLAPMPQGAAILKVCLHSRDPAYDCPEVSETNGLWATFPSARFFLSYFLSEYLQETHCTPHPISS